MHIEWEDGQADKVKGVGIVPKYSRTPGKIWRGAVGLGFDNPGGNIRSCWGLVRRS